MLDVLLNLRHQARQPLLLLGARERAHKHGLDRGRHTVRVLSCHSHLLMKVPSRPQAQRVQETLRVIGCGEGFVNIVRHWWLSLLVGDVLQVGT